MMHPTKVLLCTALAVSIGALLLGTSPTPLDASDALPLDGRWAGAAVWDDGKAEVSTYHVVRPFYGERCEGEAVFIVVKEPWEARAQVKSDTPTDVEVLKLNRMEEVTTAYYPYRFACSSFLLRDDPRIIDKVASTSQEWCGTTYQALRRRADGSHIHEWRSYFGSEGDGEAALMNQPLALLALDALPVQLRALELTEGRLGEARLIGSVISSHASELEPERVIIECAREGESWRVELSGEDGQTLARLWFAADASRLMQRAELPGGIRYELRSSERRAYWP
jgi:hypothetical protein